MRRVSALAAALAVAAIGSVVLAGAASAHVTVDAPGATKGGFAVLTFRVPNEEATASTTELRVSLPTATPIASVSVQPHPGWTVTTRSTKLAQPVKTDDGEVSEAVTEVDWKADSAASAIMPGEFDQFSISAGPLPDVDTLTLPAIQTYSDGTVVRWIETQAPGTTAEPQHPAPSVTLSAAKTPTATKSSTGSSGTAVGLSIAALALAAAALSIAVITRARVARGAAGDTGGTGGTE